MVNIKVLVFSGCYLPGYKGGGPVKTLKNLFDEAGLEISFKLVTNDRDLGDVFQYPSIECGVWNKIGRSYVYYVPPGIKGCFQIVQKVRMEDYDVLYLNSFFSPRFSILPLLLAKVIGKKVVLGPRGEFSKGALSLKSLKKRALIRVYKFFQMEKDIVFQASSNFEAMDIYEVMGSQVDVQIAEDIGARDFSDQINPRSTGPLRIVFVSRISPMKNLAVALEVLGRVKQPVVYDIYGPLEDYEYWRKCENIIRDLPKHIQVAYKGELKPDDVVRTMVGYDLFFMPTKGENYGHVIAEALCAGLPVLIANTTPWRNLQNAGIGWDLSLDNLSAFSLTIEELATMPPDKYLHLRERTLIWAKAKFSQREAVEANITLFKYATEKK